MTFTYTFADAEETTLKREDEQGNIAFIPANPANNDYAQFLASGAKAAPYVAPPEPEPLTAEEKVDKLLSDYGLTRDEMRTALEVKGQASR